MITFVLIWKQYESLCNQSFNTFERMEQVLINRFGKNAMQYCKFIDNEKHVLFYEKEEN